MTMYDITILGYLDLDVKTYLKEMVFLLTYNFRQQDLENLLFIPEIHDAPVITVHRQPLAALSPDVIRPSDGRPSFRLQ